MNTNSSSITFYCPNHLKHSFDELTKFKRISRTSIINTLMENWLRTEHQQLKEDDNLQTLLNDVKIRTHQKIGKSRIKQTKSETKSNWFSNTFRNDDLDDEPLIPLSTDNNHIDDWNDPSGIERLNELK
jgi:hypothetical protein